MIEQGERSGPSATVKFYTGFVLALLLIVAAAYAVGYRAGAAHGARAATGARQAP